MTGYARFAAFCLAVFLGSVFLSADAAAGEKKNVKDIKIGVTVGHLQEERWQREIEMFREYAAKNGFEILVQSAEQNVDNQIKQSENLLNQNIDVLILQPVDTNAAAPIIDMAHEEGVPVIVYDRLVQNSDVDYCVTFDSVKVGVKQAEFVTKVAPKGNYIWLKGGPEDNNAHLVASGHEKVLRPLIEKGDINIVLEQWCKGWDPNEALRHTENGLTLAQNDIQGVITSNDGTAGGAIQALDAQGLTGKVPTCGQDADLAACQRIVAGTQTVSIYKPLARMNLAACELAVALATGEDPKTALKKETGVWETQNNNYKDVDTFLVDVIPITRENLYEILIKQDGFQKLEDVYRNIPKDQWPDA